MEFFSQSFCLFMFGLNCFNSSFLSLCFVFAGFLVIAAEFFKRLMLSFLMLNRRTEALMPYTGGFGFPFGFFKLCGKNRLPEANRICRSCISHG